MRYEEKPICYQQKFISFKGVKIKKGPSKELRTQ